MADAPLLAVRGRATLEVEPELATVAVVVTARDKHRDPVMRGLDERSRAVAALVEPLGAAVDRFETDAVRVNPQFASGKPREKVAGYEGSVRATVVLADFAPLGELVAALAAVELATVMGPWWSLRPDSAVHRQVRVAAVHDALTRAREYAGALGAQVTELVELADDDLLSEASPVPMAPAPAMQTFRGAEAAPETITFDVVPARQVVGASVEARFRMSAPDLTT